MTAPTETGSIIAYLRLDNSEFRRAIREANSDADGLGRKSPNVRIKTNAGEVQGELLAALVAAKALNDQQSNVQVKSNASETQGDFKGLLATIALLGPAAVPMGAVTAGALAGVLPVVASLALGIKGIESDMKSGALAGTQYGHDIAEAKNQLQQLESIAAGGLLTGVDQAVSQSRPLFAALKSDIGGVSGELGTIIGGTVPALIALLHDIDPLLQDFGSQLEHGASWLEQWAKSGTGVQGFVSYVQAELPVVERTVGELVVAVSHLVEGLAPMGSVSLSTFGVLARVIGAIPIGDLSALESGIISVYLAIRTLKTVNAIIGSVGKAFAPLKAASAAAAAQVKADNLATEAAEAESARVTAEAEADKARAVAAGAREQAAALEGTDSVLAASAAEAADAAEAEIASFEATAAAAAQSAATIAAAAQTAAAEVQDAGAAASLGWRAMLGPVAAVIAGVALFSGAMHSGSASAQDMQQEVDSLTSALEQNKGAIDSNTQSIVKNALENSGAYAAANKLGVSLSDVTDAALGNADALGRIYKQLGVTNPASLRLAESLGGPELASMRDSTNATDQKTVALHDLFTALGGQNSAINTATQREKDWKAATDRSKSSADELTNSVRSQADQLGMTASQYLTARSAAEKNTEQTRAQVQAFQLERDAASLLAQALQGLAGQNLDVAQANTSVREANLQVADSFKQNGDAIAGSSKKAVANQQAVQQQVSAAQQLAQAIGQADKARGKANESEKDEIKSLRDSKAALEQQLSTQGKLTPAVQAYINKLYNVRQLQQYLNAHPLAPKIETSDAVTKLNGIITRLHTISDGANANVTITTTSRGTTSTGHLSAYATGGEILGQGGPKSDRIVARVSPHEFIVNADSYRRYGPLVRAINAGTLPGFANGGSPGGGAGFGGGDIGSLLIGSLLHAVAGGVLSQPLTGLGQQIVTTVLRAVAAGNVDAAIAKSVKPTPTTISGSAAALTAATATADRKNTAELQSQVKYQQAKTAADLLTKSLDKLKAADTANEDAARKHARALADHAAALQHDKNATDAEKAAAEDAARKASTDATNIETANRKHEASLQKLATSADNTASRAKSAYDKIKQAAQSADQVAEQAAQNLVSSVSNELSTLQGEISDFSSSISGGLTNGLDLATVWGGLGDAATSAADDLATAQQNQADALSALADAEQAVTDAQPDYASQTTAEQNQAAALQRLIRARAALTAAETSGNESTVLAATQELSSATDDYTAAQAAAATATQNVTNATGPTADQLQTVATAQANVTDTTTALTQAQNAYTDAVNDDTAAGLQSKYDTLLDSTETFADNLTKLQSEAGDSQAAQSFIAQIANMGVDAGGALATELLAAGPQGVQALVTTMGKIQDVANSEGSTLAKGFFGQGVTAIDQLTKGLESEFPDMMSALAPILDQLRAAFTITPTVTTPVTTGNRSITTTNTHALSVVASNYGTTVAALIAANKSLLGDTGDTTIKAGTKLQIPSFATGVTDFVGGLAYVHRGEMLVNAPAGTDVIRSRDVAGMGGTSAVVSRLDAIERRLAAAPSLTGAAVGQHTLSGMAAAGQRQAQQIARRYMKGGR